MADWGTTPEYLNENWTEEMLLLMTTKRADRIRRINSVANPAKEPTTRTTDTEIFKLAGIVPTIVPRRKKT